jgi:hypothetical protein
VYHSIVKRQPLLHAPLHVLSLVLIGWAPLVAHGQTDSAPGQTDSARLAGSVRSSVNGLPIAGVMIAVRGTQIFDVTNSVGGFALGGLPSGRQKLRILYQDSLSYEHDIKLTAGKTLKLAVLLDVNAVELAPIVVEAKSVRAERSLAGFYDRRKWGFGWFYTRQDLERRRGLPLESLLRESGVSVGCRPGYCLPLGWNGGRSCVMSVYLDGGPTAGDQLDLIRVDELAGVEVYKRRFDVPLEFQWGTGNACGAILLWSRN